MLLLELLPRLQNSNINIVLFWNLFTGLKFLNGLNIKSFFSFTKFSVPLSHYISMTLYLLQPPQGHNTRSSPHVTLIKPLSSLKVTHRSFRHASPHLWNQFPTSLRIPHPNIIIHPLLSDHHLNMPVSLAKYCYHLPSLFHSELKTLSSKITCSENLILHLSLFLSVGLNSWL